MDEKTNAEAVPEKRPSPDSNQAAPVVSSDVTNASGPATKAEISSPGQRPARTKVKQDRSTLVLSLAAGCVLLLVVGGVVLFLIRRVPADHGAPQGTANLERVRSSGTEAKPPVPVTPVPPIAPPAGNGNGPQDATVHFNRGVALANEGKFDEAIAAYREAIRLNPDFAEAHVNLGFALNQQGKFDESIAENRIAIRLKPDFVTAHNNLGFALAVQGQLDEAVASYRTAIRLNPNLPAAHLNLGSALNQQGKLDEAIAEFRTAIRLKPDLAVAHGNLGSALFAQGKVNEAIDAYREAIRLARETLPADSPQLAGTLAQFGLTLLEQKQWAEAEPLMRECLDIRTKTQPNVWTTFNAQSMLGAVLLGQKKYAEAEPLLLTGYQGMKEREKTIVPQGKVRLTEGTERLIDLFTATNKPDDVKKWRAAFREAIPLAREAFPKDSPQLAGWLAQVGRVLREQKQWAESEPLLRECLAIREKKEPRAWTTFNTQSMLGGVLLGQKKYAEAEPLLLAGYAGMKEREGTIPPPEKVHLTEAVERLVQLYEATGKKVGEVKPKNNSERLGLAWLAFDRKKFAVATRLWTEALAADPKLGDDRQTQHRYNAACAAALAAAGQGKDEPPLDDAAKAKLRRQAVDWLKAERTAWSKLLESGPPQARPFIVQTLSHWQKDTDLAGIRDSAALAKLPADERAACTQLWADVAALLKQAQEKPNGPRQ